MAVTMLRIIYSVTLSADEIKTLLKKVESANDLFETIIGIHSRYPNGRYEDDFSLHQSLSNVGKWPYGFAPIKWTTS
jgi:hypothetical protein